MQCPDCGSELRFSEKRNLWVCPNIDCGSCIAPGGSEVGMPSDTLSSTTLPSDFDLLPSILVIPGVEFLLEPHPLLGLYRFVDLMEVLTKFCAILGWADLSQAEVSSRRKRLLRLGREMERPTFGSWAAFLRLMCGGVKRTDDLLVPELWPPVRQSLLPLLGSQRGDYRQEVLPLRNLLAHGGVFRVDDAAALRDYFLGRFLGLVREFSFLSEVRVGRRASSRAEYLLGRSEFPVSVPGPSLENIGIVDLEEAARTSEMIVAARSGRTIRLWPLIYLDDESVRSMASMTPYLYNRFESSQVTHSGPWSSTPFLVRTDIVEPVSRLFDREAGNQGKATRAWYLEEREKAIEIASNGIGRLADIAHVLNTVRNADRGFFWVLGNAGVGKSVLMSMVFQRLCEHSDPGVRVLFHRFRRGEAHCNSIGLVASLSGQLADLCQDRVFSQQSGTFSSIERFMGALGSSAWLAGGIKTIVLLDAVDEAVAGEPDFAENLAEFGDLPGVVWVCSARTLPGVADLPPWRQHVRIFGNGMDGLDKGAIREILLEGTGRKKYDFLKRDIPGQTALANPFLESLVSRAGGLPLYIRFVVSDILTGRLTFLDETALPNGLTAYYSRLLHQGQIGDAAFLATPLQVLAALLEEPWNDCAFYVFFSWMGLIPPGDKGLRAVRDALAAGSSTLRSVCSASGGTTYSCFHDSWRQYLLKADEVSSVRHLIELTLARAVHEESRLSSSRWLQRYFRVHGGRHLLQAGRISEAVTHIVAQYRNAVAHQRWDDVFILSCDGRMVLDFVGRSGPDAIGGVSSSALIELLLEVGERSFVALLPVLRVLHRQSENWWEVVDRFVESRHWQAMFASAIVTAEESVRFLGEDDSFRVPEIMKRLNHPDRYQREFAHNVLKTGVSLTRGAQRDGVLELLVNSSGYTRDLALAESLVLLAVEGGQVLDLTVENGLMVKTWAHPAALFRESLLISAVRRQLAVSGDGALPTDRFGVEQYLAIERNRAAMADGVDGFSRRIANHWWMPSDLLEYLAGGHPDSLSGEGQIDAIRLLFEHPCWEVRERGASILARVARRCGPGIVWERQFIEGASWRVLYSLLNFSFLIRFLDEGRAFLAVVELASREESSIVRGQAAMAVQAWLGDAKEPEETRFRWDKVRNAVMRLSMDEDIWTLAELLGIIGFVRTRLGIPAEEAIEASSPLWRIGGFPKMTHTAVLDQLERELARTFR